MSTSIAAYRRALHQIPETGWEVGKTAAYLRQVLEKLPCTVFSPVGEAVCAYFDFGRRETAAFRSDMDALPVTEQTGLPFTSTHPGKMHACGHDGHMAMLLGFAEALAARQEAPCNVLLIFEPAEESTGGAQRICDTGLLEKYYVNRVYGLHLWPGLPQGTVASHAGGMMSRSCELTVEVFGESAHIAQWRQAKDALSAASDFLQEAYALAEELPCLLRFGKLLSGEARNSVSKYSRLEGTLRCFDDALYARLRVGLEALAAKLSQKTGCRITTLCSSGYPPVTNDEGLLAEARRRFAVAETEPTYITEDFSVYQQYVPGVFFFLGTGDTPPLHAPDFNFDEAVLERGPALFESLL